LSHAKVSFFFPALERRRPLMTSLIKGITSFARRLAVSRSYLDRRKKEPLVYFFSLTPGSAMIVVEHSSQARRTASCFPSARLLSQAGLILTGSFPPIDCWNVQPFIGTFPPLLSNVQSFSPRKLPLSTSAPFCSLDSDEIFRSFL